MKTLLKSFFTTGLVLGGFVSCTSNDLNEMDENISSVHATICELEADDPDTRLSFNEINGSTLWELGDTLGVFPETGHQVSFPISEGAGTTKAEFNGGSWALKKGYNYAAYYPFDFYNRDNTNIPISYLGQVQNGMNSSKHIGSHFFMASELMSTDGNLLNFRLNALGCILRLYITLPEATTYTGLKLLMGDKYIPVCQSFDITTSKLTDRKLASNLEVTLENIKTSTKGEKAYFYMMVPAMPLRTGSNGWLKVAIRDIHGNIYVGPVYKSTGNITETEFPQGKYKGWKADPVLSDGMNSNIEGWGNGGEWGGVAQ